MDTDALVSLMVAELTQKIEAGESEKVDALIELLDQMPLEVQQLVKAQTE